ncbi:MAG: hypothetical protein C9356_15815 [Oleiphilus sp.]|nr:MAG: hypothetical protein C9356_15815 [Oleiphilus sp.]
MNKPSKRTAARAGSHAATKPGSDQLLATMDKVLATAQAFIESTEDYKIEVADHLDNLAKKVGGDTLLTGKALENVEAIVSREVAQVRDEIKSELEQQLSDIRSMLTGIMDGLQSGSASERKAASKKVESTAKAVQRSGSAVKKARAPRKVSKQTAKKAAPKAKVTKSDTAKPTKEHDRRLSMITGIGKQGIQALIDAKITRLEQVANPSPKNKKIILAMRGGEKFIEKAKDVLSRFPDPL